MPKFTATPIATTPTVGLRWRWAHFSSLDLLDFHALMMLRQAVFVVEQTCPYQDADGRDPIAWHLLGYQGDELVACLRVFGPGVVREEAVIGRVVTGPTVRGTGQGRPLMREGIARLEEVFGPQLIWISAQAHLAPFYGSVGFQVCGPGYLEDDIPHLPMLRAANPDVA